MPVGAAAAPPLQRSCQSEAARPAAKLQCLMQERTTNQMALISYQTGKLARNKWDDTLGDAPPFLRPGRYGYVPGRRKSGGISMVCRDEASLATVGELVNRFGIVRSAWVGKACGNVEIT